LNRLSLETARRVVAASAWIALMGSGCAPEIERQSEVGSLRVLAVRDEVTLRMLFHDGSPRAPRPLDIWWLAGCENPPGDLFQGCTERFGQVGPDGGSALIVGRGSPIFSFRLSTDIISEHPPSTDPSQPPFGIAYVFFAVCAGELEILSSADEGGFPARCVEDGNVQGARDFVAGYTSIFAYEDHVNANPIVTGFQVRDVPVPHDCIGVECVSGGPPVPIFDGGTEGGMGSVDGGAVTDAGARDAGALEPPPADCAFTDPRCVEVCDEDEELNCPKIPIRPAVLRESAEVDSVLAAAGQGELLEQMWVNYYVDHGSVASDARLLNDATTGWNDLYGTDYRAPKEPGVARVWAVVHDNRGGAEWVRTTLRIRPAP
jgi:hypothetical protein